MKVKFFTSLIIAVAFVVSSGANLVNARHPKRRSSQSSQYDNRAGKDIGTVENVKKMGEDMSSQKDNKDSVNSLMNDNSKTKKPDKGTDAKVDSVREDSKEKGSKHSVSSTNRGNYSNGKHSSKYKHSSQKHGKNKKKSHGGHHSKKDCNSSSKSRKANKTNRKA